MQGEKMKRIATFLSASVVALSFSESVRADSPGEVELLRQQVQELLKRIDKLEKKAEQSSQADMAAWTSRKSCLFRRPNSHNSEFFTG